MKIGYVLLVLVAAAALLSPPLTPTAAAQPSVAATLPVELYATYTGDVPGGVEWVGTVYLTVKRDVAYDILVVADGPVTVYVDGEAVALTPGGLGVESEKLTLKKGTHNVTVVVGAVAGGQLVLVEHGIYYNMSFSWPLKVGEDGWPELELRIEHGVTWGAPSERMALPTDYVIKVDLRNPVRTVTGDKGAWRASGTAVYGEFSGTLPDGVTVKVTFAPPQVSESAVRVVDNWGQEAMLPHRYSRVLVGSQFTVQPLLKDVSILHFVNGTQAPSFRFDKHTLHKCALLAYKVVSEQGLTYPVLNLTSFDVTPKRLSVEYSTWSAEELPFTLKLSGDLSRVGAYNLVFEAKGTTLGVLTGTERVHVNGTVSTVGTYTVKEDAEWYNVSITYPVEAYTLTHPLVQKVYSLEPVTVAEDKVYLTVTAGKPLVVKGQRKVVRATSDVGDAPLSSAGDLSFVGITRPSTWTVKLATYVTVHNVLESGKPVSATVRVLDTKGNVVAQATGATVTFELEPLVNYVVTSDTGVERASRFVYLTDDAEITFTFTQEPPVEVPTDLITAATLVIVAAAAVYIAWRLSKGGLTLEISA